MEKEKKKKKDNYFKYYSQSIVVFLVSNWHVDSKLLTGYFFFNWKEEKRQETKKSHMKMQKSIFTSFGVHSQHKAGQNTKQKETY